MKKFRVKVKRELIEVAHIIIEVADDPNDTLDPEFRAENMALADADTDPDGNVLWDVDQVGAAEVVSSAEVEPTE